MQPESLVLDLSTGTLMNADGSPHQAVAPAELPEDLKQQIITARDRGVPIEKVIEALQSGKIEIPPGIDIEAETRTLYGQQEGDLLNIL